VRLELGMAVDDVMPSLCCEGHLPAVRIINPGDRHTWCKRDDRLFSPPYTTNNLLACPGVVLRHLGRTARETVIQLSLQGANDARQTFSS